MVTAAVAGVAPMTSMGSAHNNATTAVSNRTPLLRARAIGGDVMFDVIFLFFLFLYAHHT